MLKNKNILIGVTGSIAAYKSALLIRLLVKAGANVKVIMTPASLDFITPLTLSTLAKNPVFIDFVKNKEGEWNNHVALGLWADAFVIAPASANTLAKMGTGICDNLLLATYLSARCPVFFAPAMDLDMYKHPSTLKNLAALKAYGNILIPPGTGELASGLNGEGRMAEPEEIFDFLKKKFADQLALSGKKVLITAGPTYEALDPVRFIGNHSTGKMGFALAEECANQGAEVSLICGPTTLVTANKSINRIDITSAEELYTAAVKEFQTSDVSILSAAVADFKPDTIAKQKIKKTDSPPVINLVPTKDTLLELGKLKKKNQLLVGFALETENEIENAKKKIKNKNLDLIVLNSLNDKGAGFKGDTNKVTIIDKYNNLKEFQLKTKQEVAKDILNTILDFKNS
ncbi:MAG TPA: bifunctional phosphopantothenoylcysteine decarboxylase/phosphopantothenate--cysteine ligase CoaBC [Bacteroidia bacterium]|jgi:phosphopantothenoylcysteine decarboxylase/phosphopantothenate--cysteine ligase|nr:bifunctional phosphopantothenoylcysteine decarboxylase/phosphopantothenate--cysteine ligase CoaBC [Bacteroidia bacterium]